jgi:hypothetical protein
VHNTLLAESAARPPINPTLGAFPRAGAACGAIKPTGASRLGGRGWPTSPLSFSLNSGSGECSSSGGRSERSCGRWCGRCAATGSPPLTPPIEARIAIAQLRPHPLRLEQPSSDPMRRLHVQTAVLLSPNSLIRLTPTRERVRIAGANCASWGNMPSTINLYQIGVWFCVGFFTGAGWAIAAWRCRANLLPYLSASACRLCRAAQLLALFLCVARQQWVAANF